ncbi:MAG: NAD(P)-binding protein [Ignavibacteria bacterium]|nr:NAD(P)-binding protein [Ignavibacteria bacterium]
MKSVLIIGGGLAGISAAINLSEKNLKIRLFESSPQLGGRFKSYFEKDLNLWFDNGQHLLISGYRETLELLDKINVKKNFLVQNKFAVKFRDKKLKEWSLTYSNSFEDFINLLKFRNLEIKDKFRLLNFLVRIRKYEEKVFENLSVIDLLKFHQQSENLINNFWQLFVESTMNSPIEKASAKVFIFILKKMFFEDFKNARLIIPEKSFFESFLIPAENFLFDKNVEIIKNCSITKLEFQNSRVHCAIDNHGEKHFADYFILAVPYHSYLRLMNEKEIKLSFQSIINAHIIFENYNGEIKFFALWNSPVHWAFFHKTHITLTKSNAEEFVHLNDQTLKEIFLTEFLNYFPEYKNRKIVYFKIIKEKRATFISDFSSIKHRVKTETDYPNLFIAGDFTDTNFPSTIESAVKSGKLVAEKILNTNSKV